MQSIYRCSGCGGWFQSITIIGDYKAGEYGPLMLCEADSKQLDEDMKMLEEFDNYDGL